MLPTGVIIEILLAMYKQNRQIYTRELFITKLLSSYKERRVARRAAVLKEELFKTYKKQYERDAMIDLVHRLKRNFTI